MAEALRKNEEDARRAAEALPHHEPAIDRSRARKLYTIVGIAVAVIVIAYVAYKLIAGGRESTDDAQVDADVVPVASRVAGQILTLHVIENHAVRKGELLAEIDPQDANVKLQQALGELETANAQAAEADARAAMATSTARGSYQQAQSGVTGSREAEEAAGAQVGQAEANVKRAAAAAEKARLDFERASNLVEKGDIPRAQLDAARAARDAADADLAQSNAALRAARNNQQRASAAIGEAQGKFTQSSDIGSAITAARAAARLAHAKVKTAQAAVDAARLNLSYTRIVAPADGIASKLSVQAGQLVTPGQPICELVPKNTYVVANFKETQLHGIKPGQKAKIEVDALHGEDFEGRVESLSGGTGAAFAMLPPDNASGNFVKVVQRVPVRIAWSGPDATRVPVGSSVTVTVYAK